MYLINAKYLDKDFRLAEGDIQVEEGKIVRTGPALPRKPEETAVDCAGYTIVPGFVDVHIHGCDGADTCDGTPEALHTMARFLLAHGVTSFCPTTMTTGRKVIEKALLAAKDLHDTPLEDGAKVVGVNMEGPFISKERKGAQKEEDIVAPNFPLFQELFDLSGGLVKLVDIAPEQPGGEEFVKKARELCGVVGAVFDDGRVRAELICDGQHIHPAVLRTAFQALGDRALIVSDSMRANGMPEGAAFDLGGQMVTVTGGKATLADGTIAGSVSNLHQEVKNLVSWGVPFQQAVKSASLIPARAIGLDGEIGSIEPGKAADLVVLDQNLDIASVWVSQGGETKMLAFEK